MVARLVAVGLASLALAPAGMSAGLPGGRAIAVTTSLSPDVHLFAEPVVARVRVVVDRRRLAPDRIEVRTDFAPYERLGPVEESRRTVGELVELTYEARLRCLSAECIAPRFATALGEQEGGRAERFVHRFGPVEVLDGEQLLLQRPFPALEVVSRINTASLDTGSTYRAGLEPPAATYRLGPGPLAAAALALAVLLLLLPAWLAGRAMLARWRRTRRRRRLSPLERALVLVEWTGTLSDGEHDRRRALEALADALERSGTLPLAEAARTAAWSEEPPDPQSATELAAEAKGEDARVA